MGYRRERHPVFDVGFQVLKSWFVVAVHSCSQRCGLVLLRLRPNLVGIVRNCNNIKSLKLATYTRVGGLVVIVISDCYLIFCGGVRTYVSLTQHACVHVYVCGTWDSGIYDHI